jgi:hypothetical protein
VFVTIPLQHLLVLLKELFCSDTNCCGPITLSLLYPKFLQWLIKTIYLIPHSHVLRDKRFRVYISPSSFSLISNASSIQPLPELYACCRDLIVLQEYHLGTRIFNNCINLNVLHEFKSCYQNRSGTTEISNMLTLLFA